MAFQLMEFVGADLWGFFVWNSSHTRTVLGVNTRNYLLGKLSACGGMRRANTRYTARHVYNSRMSLQSDVILTRKKKNWGSTQNSELPNQPTNQRTKKWGRLHCGGEAEEGLRTDSRVSRFPNLVPRERWLPGLGAGAAAGQKIGLPGSFIR